MNVRNFADNNFSHPETEIGEEFFDLTSRAFTGDFHFQR
jgi:hypothetical protein